LRANTREKWIFPGARTNWIKSWFDFQKTPPEDLDAQYGADTEGTRQLLKRQAIWQGTKLLAKGWTAEKIAKEFGLVPTWLSALIP
jgi:hypothetical protein